MDWNNLKYLIAVSEKGSLKAAASYLNVNHSTAWRKIRNLEQQLGSQLFIVEGKSYQLTEVGERILANTRKIESLADEIVDHSRQEHEHIKGLVRVTAPAYFANQYLPHAILKFHAIHPDVQFEVLEGNESLDINQRKSDIAIRATASIPDNLIGRKLKDVPWGIYASEEFIHRYQIDPSKGKVALNGLPIISYLSFNNEINKWFQLQTKDNLNPILTNSVESALSFAVNHVGLSFLPSEMATNLIELKRLPPATPLNYGY